MQIWTRISGIDPLHFLIQTSVFLSFPLPKLYGTLFGTFVWVFHNLLATFYHPAKKQNNLSLNDVVNSAGVNNFSKC